MKIYKRAKPKRQRKGLTNYYKRIKLVKSNLPRLVVRKTDRYIITQITLSKVGGDYTYLTVNSKELSKYGWKNGFKNIPAAYLTGFLLGIKSKKIGINKAILDIGLQKPVKGSRVFAVAKGAIDAGLEIPISEEVIPSEERIKGKHIEDFKLKLLEESKLIESDHIPITSIFEKVKNNILKEIGVIKNE
ncbi:MAG: 50S ribosomal protein L18 [Nitrososphaerota archaeon]